MNANGTQFTFSAATKGPPDSDALLVPLPATPQPPMELVTRVDRLCDDAVSELLDVDALRDTVGHIAQTTCRGQCRRIVLISLGEEEKLRAHEVRRAAAAAARWLIGERVKSATLWLDGLAVSGVDNASAEWASGMALAGHRFDEFKQPDERTPAKIRVQLRASSSAHVTRAMPLVREALLLSDAVNYTRQLSHQPANVLTPTSFAAEAKRLAGPGGIKCTVHNAAKLKQMKMGGLLAVGCGSVHAPCLVQLNYRGAPKARTTTVLVGKAVTFDTGGYSIKPSAGLEEMKFDKCGGVTVLGAIKAAAALKLKCNLVGLIPVAENSVSDRAYRPGDILRMMSGKTVEVTNTDAEGRLILADALWYAQTKLKPTALIDLATLTGGVGVALGTAAAGIMSNDDNLAADLGEAGRRAHERLWRLPLWDDYRELIKSTEADIKNSAGKRAAHAIVGGMFLREFVKDDIPWAHLDIASVATLDTSNGITGKGATGFGVRLLVELLRLRGA